MKYSFYTILAFYLVVLAFFIYLGAGLTKWSADVGSKLGENMGALVGGLLGVGLCAYLWVQFGEKMAESVPWK